MTQSLGSRYVGTRYAVIASCLTIILASPTILAQETKAEPLFGNNVLDLLLESRNKKPASQATPQERAAAVDELTGIYLISNLPRAKELGQSPQLRAQIELQERAMIFNAFATEFLASSQPTEQEVFDVYTEQVALAPPKEFKARHILSETQAAAIALIEELQGGADFVELAKANSTGPSAPSGGDLGWFTAQAMVAPFSSAVAALDDGAFTEAPVQTQFGWHVILREESRDSAPPPLDSVRDVIVQRIAQQKLQEFIEGLRSNAAE